MRQGSAFSVLGVRWELVLVTLTALFAPGRAQAGGAVLSSENVLLVTFDTTRADRLGCYGYDKAVTPTLDKLASTGVLFEEAHSPVPLTLPAHTSILTGRYPREHGIHNNAREGVGADMPTLATIFKEKGYKTGAFVASFVLDSRFGLDRGFDVYDDDMGTTSLDSSPLERERPANIVADRALAWLDTAKTDRFFAWVHFYDPHDPYQPPPDFKGVGAGPYDAEIAFADTQLRRLVQWLDESKLRERTLVIVVADHGEAFGEHGEFGHSMFLSDAVLRVPLIVNLPKAATPGTRVAAVVETLDLFPTVLELFGWDKPEYRLKRSFASALRGAELADRPAFSECLYPFYTYGWAEQRCVTAGRWKYISSTRPELFDRKNDPREKTNLIEREPDIAANLAKALRDHFDSLVPGAAKTVQLAAVDAQKLRALGYAGSGVESKDFLTPGALDPKDHIDTVNKVKHGETLIREKHPELAIPLLNAAAQASPNSLAIQAGLGSAHVRLLEKLERTNVEDIDPAIITNAHAALTKVLKLDPRNEMALVAMGDILMRQGKFEEAIKHYDAVLQAGGDAYTDLFGKKAQALNRLGRVNEALPLYQKAIQLDPELGEVQLDLGVIYMDQGLDSKALAALHEAVRLIPNNPDAHYNLGLALLKIDQVQDAANEFERATILRPKFAKALINWGIALYKLDQKGFANLKFLEAEAVPGYKAAANFNLAVTLAKDDRKMDSVVFFEKAVRADPTYAPAIEELTRYYVQMKRPKDAVRVLRRATENIPNDVRFTHTLAKILATAETDSVRDGAEGLKFATKASELTNRSHPAVEGTLAAAYAETGDFAKAVETATKAVTLATAANQPDLAAALQAQIELYQARKPFRNPDF